MISDNNHNNTHPVVVAAGLVLLGLGIRAIFHPSQPQVSTTLKTNNHIRHRRDVNPDGTTWEVIVSLANNEKVTVPSAKDLMSGGFWGEVGAIATFEGVTRNSFEGKQVTELEYEAYEAMALETLAQIAQDSIARFNGLRKVVIIHRLGSCPVGETSLFVGTVSAHRSPAMLALPHLVDELKLKVPIWKLEKYANGAEATWKENSGWNPNALASPSST